MGLFLRRVNGYVIKPGANLTLGDLSGVNLTGANLNKANLSNAKLWRANLTGANLVGANLTKANLTGANLTGTVCPDGSNPAGRGEGSQPTCPLLQ